MSESKNKAPELSDEDLKQVTGGSSAGNNSCVTVDGVKVYCSQGIPSFSEYYYQFGQNACPGFSARDKSLNLQACEACNCFSADMGYEFKCPELANYLVPMYIEPNKTIPSGTTTSTMTFEEKIKLFNSRLG